MTVIAPFVLSEGAGTPYVTLDEVKFSPTAAALDFGTSTMNSSYDARGEFHYHDAIIHDAHGENRWLNVGEILVHSSNIGSARMALDLGNSLPHQCLRLPFVDRGQRDILFERHRS